MALKGEAKKEYQRRYMERKRKTEKALDLVRPNVLDPVTPKMSRPAKLPQNTPTVTPLSPKPSGDPVGTDGLHLYQNKGQTSPMVSGLGGVKALSAIRKLPVYNPNVTGFHPAPKGGK